jgi:hypothetical protein
MILLPRCSKGNPSSSNPRKHEVITMWAEMHAVQSARLARIWKESAIGWAISPLQGWTIACGAHDPTATASDSRQGEILGPSATEILNTVSGSIAHALRLIDDVNDMLVSLGLTETLRLGMIRHMVKYVLEYYLLLLTEHILPCFIQSVHPLRCDDRGKKHDIPTGSFDHLLVGQNLFEQNMLREIFVGSSTNTVNLRPFYPIIMPTAEVRVEFHRDNLYEIMAEYVYASSTANNQVITDYDVTNMEDRFGSSINSNCTRNVVTQYGVPHFNISYLQIPPYCFEERNPEEPLESTEENGIDCFDFAEAAERLPRPSREHLVLQLWDTGPYLH